MKKIEFVNSQVGFFSNGTEVFLTVNGGKDISKLFNWSTYSEAEDDYYNFYHRIEDTFAAPLAVTTMLELVLVENLLLL